MDYQNLEFDPAANIFPLMEGADFDALVEDIRTNGLKQKITIHKEKIIDGRNRYLALKAAGITPGYWDFGPDFGGSDPVDYVVSCNLHRRHLSESQRSMIAAKVATMKQGSRTDLTQICTKSIPEAASMMNVSPRLVSSAKKVIATGDKELIAAVDSGQVAVSAAVKKIDQEKQQPVMTMGSQDKPTNTASKERLPVKRAGQYVDLAILQLERILDDDPTAQSALSRLTEWIEQKQKRLQG